MNVAVDAPETLFDFRLGPALDRPSQIDTDDFA